MSTTKPTREISALAPEMQEKAKQFLALCAEAGIKVTIYSTFRTLEEQAVEYAKGRTTPGPIVSWAPPGSSWHNYGLAFDCVPVVNGKAVWNNSELWEKVGKIGESIGLEWGGRFKRVKKGKVDKPHFQLTGGKTIEEMRSIYGYAKS